MPRPSARFAASLVLVGATALLGMASVTGRAGTATVKPSITSFTPASGAVGSRVTISGENFDGTSEVKFSGKATLFTVVSATSMKATVPAGATTGRITVTNTAGSAISATQFTVLPKITSFSPTSGKVGASVTISGSGFTGITSVTFGTVAATFTRVSSTSI